MSLIALGIAIGAFLWARTAADMWCAAGLIALTFVVNAAERYGDRRRERLRKSTAAGVPVREGEG